MDAAGNSLARENGSAANGTILFSADLVQTQSQSRSLLGWSAAGLLAMLGVAGLLISRLRRDSGMVNSEYDAHNAEYDSTYNTYPTEMQTQVQTEVQTGEGWSGGYYEGPAETAGWYRFGSMGAPSR